MVLGEPNEADAGIAGSGWSNDDGESHGKRKVALQSLHKPLRCVALENGIRK